MPSATSRRDLLIFGGVGAATLAWGSSIARAQPASPRDPTTHSGFPRLDLALVKEVVSVAHFNEARTRELVELRPALANAAWDWGFGDWETPLGAAAHTGRRDLAAFLIARGARIDIFAAAMLGQLDVLRALVAANPGVHRTLGPHAITLVEHARAGGEPAKPVLEFLQSLEGDGAPAILPLDEALAAPYLGAYSFGPSPADRFIVRLDKSRLMLTKSDDANVRIHRVAEHEFFPAGVPSTRIRFELVQGKARTLTLLQAGSAIISTRVPD